MCAARNKKEAEGISPYTILYLAYMNKGNLYKNSKKKMKLCMVVSYKQLCVVASARTSPLRCKFFPHVIYNTIIVHTESNDMRDYLASICKFMKWEGCSSVDNELATQ